MRNTLRLIVLILSLSGMSALWNSASATHVAGGYIQLQCTGTPGQYILRLVLYRDCGGATLGNTATITATNTCGLGTQNFTVTRVSTTEVSQLCAAQLNQSECNGGTLPGYQEVIYTATINIGACNTWTFAYSLCCRNSSINVSGQPTFYTTTTLNSATNNCNTTPLMTAQPEPFVCINQPVTYNIGASEPNGHTFTYQLVSAQQGAGSNVPYNGGYSGTAPVTGISINASTGTVTFTPTVLGAFIIVIRVNEYDANGNLLSTTNYDYQTFVINCSNQAPQPPAAGISNVTGSIVQTGANAVTFCQGFNGCFNVVFTDPNAANTMLVTSNLATVLPGATISTTGTNPVTVTVCWTPSAAQANETVAFTVEDNACPITGFNNYAVLVNVTNPGSATVTTTPPPCAGLNQGTANIAVTGGNPPFTYNITGAATASNSTGSFTNLPAGNYNYTVTQGAGCQLTGTFTVPAGPALTNTTSFISPTCNALCNGSATITPNGGTAPYSYVWSQGGTPIGQTTQTASNLCAGTYTVVATSANGCTTNGTVVVTQPAVLAATATSTGVACSGNCNGTVTVNAPTGGTAPYQYSIDGGAFQAGTTFNGLCAGAHSVTVKDANNCTVIINVNVATPAPLTLAVSNNTPASCGLANGSVTVSGSGGTTAYTYSLGGTTNGTGIFGSLAPGTYNFTVTDAHGCTATVSATVSNQPGPVASIGSQTNLSCFGGANGAVVINAVGGTGALTYDLNPGPAAGPSNSFSNLTAGAYSVIVADANGCTSTVNFTITAPTQLTFTSVMSPALCNGQATGSITVNANNATPPYQYSSNGGIVYQPSNVLGNLAAGTYSVVVQDANGCIANANVVVTQPTALTGSLTPTNPICPGACNGVIAITSGGGTAPIQYSLNGGALQASNSFNTACAGNNAVLIQDNNGCQLNLTTMLVDPAPFTVDTLSTDPSNCGFNDGGFTLQITGASNPVSINCVDCGIVQASPTFTNLVAGAYQVIVTDALGCQITYFAPVSDIQMQGALVSVTDVTCFNACDADVELAGSGGFGTLTYDIDNGLMTQLGSGVFSGLCAGNHAGIITDQGFCVAVVPFVVNEPDSIYFSSTATNGSCSGGANGTITFGTPTGGNGVYQYSVDGGATYQASNSFTGLPAGTYNLMVMDGNNCLGSGTATITEPTPVAFTNTVSDVVCNGGSTGSIGLNASGGTAPYTYSNNGGATFIAFPVFSLIPAGNYNIVVMDNNGCQITGIVTVNQPAALTATAVSDSVNCFGDCDGAITVTANGGVAPYQYSQNNGTNFSVSNTISGLCQGTYNMLVRDDNGCNFTFTQTVAQPTQVSISVTPTESTCSNANGAINIVASGGTPGYQYSINGGTSFQTSATFNGLTAQSYNVVTEDQYGCEATTVTTVVDEASPVINFILPTATLCNGSADGTLTVTATGGTGALQYSLNGGPAQASNLFSGLIAGTYNITVTDANGCSDTQSQTITEPTPVAFTSTTTPLLCFNDFTGAIDVNASGGVGNYEYSYDGGTIFTASSSSNFIAAGTYNLVVQDMNGCQATGTATVTQPTQLVFGLFNTFNATCNGVCDGGVTAFPSGGTVSGLYNFNWSNSLAGTNQAQAANVCAGNYSLTVTDDNGCQIDTSWTITEPPAVVIDTITGVNALCFGDCNASINITAPLATQFSIDNGNSFQGSGAFANLCPGTYNVEVQDAAGCPAFGSITVSVPDLLTLAVNNDTTICSGAVDTLFAWGTGGVQPYTYAWSNGATNYFEVINAISDTSLSVIITDFNGCVTNAGTSNIFLFPQLVLTAMADTIVCPGGSVTLTSAAAGGQAPYNYVWSSGAITANASVTPPSPTNYIITVTDACNVSIDDTVFVDYYALPQIAISSDVTQGCSPLAVQFTNTTPAGQIGGNCIWTIDGQTFNGCAGPSYTFIQPGCHDVTLQLTSSDGCVHDSTFVDAVCVFAIPVADFSWTPGVPTVLNSTVYFTDESTNASTYTWDFAGLGNSTTSDPIFNFDPDSSGNYQVCLQIVSPDGCIDDTCKTIFIADEYLLYVPNTFTPDGDGINDIFIPSIQSVDPEHYELMIFNRWGELIFQTQNVGQGWDGTYKALDSKQDVYVWKIKCRDLNTETQREYYGHVNLLR